VIMFASAADSDTPLPNSDEARLILLVKILRERRCLLVLDNFEPLIDSGECDDTYVGYGRLLQLLAETSHQGCVILTSRVASPQLGPFQNDQVHTLELAGLGIAEAQLLLYEKRLSGTGFDWSALVSKCGGNPLLLVRTSATISQVFGGDIRAFLDTLGTTGVHEQVRRLLASQLDERLSVLEQELLRVLASSDTRLTRAALLAEFGPRFGLGAVIEALLSLRRRSVVRQPVDAGLTLLPIVRDYVAGQLAPCAAA
jgi:hypothetical protein